MDKKPQMICKKVSECKMPIPSLCPYGKPHEWSYICASKHGEDCFTCVPYVEPSSPAMPEPMPLIDLRKQIESIGHEWLDLPIGGKDLNAFITLIMRTITAHDQQVRKDLIAEIIGRFADILPPRVIADLRAMAEKE